MQTTQPLSLSDNMFTTERELVCQLRENYSSICHWSGTTKVLEEVDLGFGIADLVFSRLSSKPINSKTVLNYLDVTIYKIIETQKKISFEKIREITKANTAAINKTIEKLALESYIQKQDTVLEFNKAYKPIALETVAIEAKLKNWRKALLQAYRYRWFASYSFVVLDSKYIVPAVKNLNEFEKLNVGLAEISKQNKVKVHSRPISNDPIDPKMTMVFNEQLKASLLQL